MYRRPLFLEALLKIREEMAREADYDVDLFSEMVRANRFSDQFKKYDLSGIEKVDGGGSTVDGRKSNI